MARCEGPIATWMSFKGRLVSTKQSFPNIKEAAMSAQTMSAQPHQHVLTINTGSSSVKAALYEMQAQQLPADAAQGHERRLLSAEFTAIGSIRSHMRIAGAAGEAVVDQPCDLPDQHTALTLLFACLRQRNLNQRVDVVGHRFVYGGLKYSEPAIVDGEMILALEEMSSLAPEHLPGALAAARFVQQQLPNVPQIGCFDTAFHQQLPDVAQRYAIPRRLHDEGIRRFGFHGLSYEFVMDELRRSEVAHRDGRVIVAHLGNGASMAAVRGGQCIDTSMGFTPASGLVMGSRAGDIDAGVVLHLLTHKKMTTTAVSALLNHHSGLLGMSGTSADMRELLTREGEDVHAAKAIELFCYRAKTYLGAYVATLGGLDLLVFSGGIGEHASEVRARICAGLECFAIRIDAALNKTNAEVISSANSGVEVRVIATDEGLMIARHAIQVLTAETSR